MKKIIELYKKYKEIINYIIVGGCTTIVSIVSYYLFRLFINGNYYLFGLCIEDFKICTIISWIIAVIFAYFTNRIFVFNSRDKNILSELFKFIMARILSLLSELLVMDILVKLINIDDKISKIIVQFIVLVLNYIFSKIFVFKKR